MASPVQEATIPPAFDATRIRTRWLVAILIVATVGLTWYTNQMVLTRDVYHHLLSAQMDESRIDANFDLMQRVARWGYLAIPMAVGFRIVVVSLVLQLFLLLFMIEIPFKAVARAVTFAYPAILFTSIMKTIVLATSDVSTLTTESLNVVPGSVANFVMEPSNTALYALLGQFSLAEAAWCVVVVAALSDGRRAQRWQIVTTVVLSWILLTALQWGTTAYIAGVRS